MKQATGLLRKLYSLRRGPYLHRLRAQVTNRKFLILSGGCNGGLLLHDLGMCFNTPTVNLSMHGFDRFCADLEHYLALTPVPVEDSGEDYPVAMLGDLRIDAMHYRDFEDFLSAWNRRLARFNALREEGYEILLLAMESELSPEGGMERFLSLPYRKVCFTRDPEKAGGEVIFLPNRKRNGYRDSWRAAGLCGIRVFERAMDVPAFLNGSTGA